MANARIVFMPECAEGTCPADCSHQCWECPDCACSGGMGADRHTLARLAQDHNDEPDKCAGVVRFINDETARAMSDATTVLREWAQAIRGAWGDIDGRSCKDELTAIADWIDTPKTAPDITVMRQTVGICLDGNGHWNYFCTPDACPNEQSTDEVDR
jgi:hypothetical protein